MTDISQLKAGQCIRMRKNENIRLAGARIAAMRHVLRNDTVELITVYKYLFLTKVEDERIFGIDLENLGELAFRKEGAGHMVKFDPLRRVKLVDFWGWEDLHVLSEEELRGIIEKRALELDAEVRRVSREAIEYRVSTQHILNRIRAVTA